MRIAFQASHVPNNSCESCADGSANCGRQHAPRSPIIGRMCGTWFSLYIGRLIAMNIPGAMAKASCIARAYLAMPSHAEAEELQVRGPGMIRVCIPQKPAYATSMLSTCREIDATTGSGEVISIQDAAWQMNCFTAELGVSGVSTASKGGIMGAESLESNSS